MSGAGRASWLRLLAALGALALIVAAAPWVMDRWFREHGRRLEARDLEADGLFYTETKECSEAYHFFSNGGGRPAPDRRVGDR